MDIVAEDGLEGLSLREVARRLGVSHQAPYRHFTSREHILAEVIARTFHAFSTYLEGRNQSEDPYEDFRHLAEAYFDYAAQHPLEYRLMFNTPMPNTDDYPGLGTAARTAYAHIRGAVAKLPEARSAGQNRELDSLFVWSALHGQVSILASCAARILHMPDDVKTAAITNTLDRLVAGMKS